MKGNKRKSVWNQNKNRFLHRLWKQNVYMIKWDCSTYSHIWHIYIRFFIFHIFIMNILLWNASIYTQAVWLPPLFLTHVFCHAQKIQSKFLTCKKYKECNKPGCDSSCYSGHQQHLLLLLQTKSLMSLPHFVTKRDAHLQWPLIWAARVWIIMGNYCWIHNITYNVFLNILNIKMCLSDSVFIGKTRSKPVCVFISQQSC